MADIDTKNTGAHAGSESNASAQRLDGDSKDQGSRNTSRGGRGGRGRERGSRGDRSGRGRGGGRGGGGRGFGSNDGDRPKRKGERGRSEWSREKTDKRKRNEEQQESKRRKLEDGGKDSIVGVKYSAEEIASEDRRPKRKVAVYIGYAGTGYKGMQINDQEKTIEGDLFNAFVKAGAISKANADDPKKSSLVRCARTDKGVHAAGNIISLKLIVDDTDIVQKINENLPPQIRVWGFERTNGSFSCYQSCDSRWYEYLIPTYSFIPPHPRSYLGKKLVDAAEKQGTSESYKSRQEDAASFWEQTDKEYIEPILAKIDTDMATAVMETVYKEVQVAEPSDKKKAKAQTKEVTDAVDENGNANIAQVADENAKDTGKDQPASESKEGAEEGAASTDSGEVKKAKRVIHPFDAAVAEVKAAYIRAKMAYRIHPSRRQRLQDALNQYLGTQNYHNYTILKGFKDPSAKRVIRSFDVGKEPIIINDTEWLSLKVHGQSFMMHQIRKMVAMATLVVRCGSDLSIIRESYGPDKMSIPKAPSLGLLLERPVFDSYNVRAQSELQREKIEFTKFEKEMDDFKQREIYNRIFDVENQEHQFHTFFHHIDQYPSDFFLWVTAEGIAATRQAKAGQNKAELDSEDEGAQGNEEG